MHSFSDIRRVFNDDGQDNDRGQWENEQQNSSTFFFFVFFFLINMFLYLGCQLHMQHEKPGQNNVSLASFWP